MLSNDLAKTDSTAAPSTFCRNLFKQQEENRKRSSAPPVCASNELHHLDKYKHMRALLGL